MTWRYATAFLLCIVTSTAFAQEAGESPQVSEARTHYDLGSRHYDAGDYALALTEFSQAYDLMRSVRHPNAGLILFSMARCYSRLGRDREALASFEQFLREAPPNATQRADAEAELRELRARAELGGGGGISPVGPIIAAVGAAALIAGAVTGGLALAASADATEGCVDGLCPPENEGRYEEAVLLANVTDGLLWGGLAVAAVGVILIFVLPGDEEPAPVAAACTGDGCAMFARGRF